MMTALLLAFLSVILGGAVIYSVFWFVAFILRRRFYTNNAGIKKMSIQNTLSEREKTHGDFDKVASLAQILKSTMLLNPNWGTLPMTHREALDLIATKIARIMCGNPNEPDHWRDIAGYATLIENDLKGGAN